MHTFLSNVYSSIVINVPYYTMHAQCMLHPHISREGASNDMKVLRPKIYCGCTISRSRKHYSCSYIKSKGFALKVTLHGLKYLYVHYAHKTNLQLVALLLQQFPVQLHNIHLKMILTYLYQWDHIALELEERITGDEDQSSSEFPLGSRQDQSGTTKERVISGMQHLSSR